MGARGLGILSSMAGLGATRGARCAWPGAEIPAIGLVDRAGHDDPGLGASGLGVLGDLRAVRGFDVLRGLCHDPGAGGGQHASSGAVRGPFSRARHGFLSR